MTDDQLSHRLSYLLRHAPQEAGLTLAVGGWVPLDALLQHLNVSREQVGRVVAASDKQRFGLQPGPDGERIRANQGHSVPVDLGLGHQRPPALLYHGTVTPALAAIRTTGLRPMTRHHVHLSADVATAQRVGARRGVPIILTIQAGRMHGDGLTFLCSDNAVWLTDWVPPAYLVWPD
jgi:putative RNA 2'-phosphotransferase